MFDVWNAGIDVRFSLLDDRNEDRDDRCKDTNPQLVNSQPVTCNSTDEVKKGVERSVATPLNKGSVDDPIKKIFNSLVSIR